MKIERSLLQVVRGTLGPVQMPLVQLSPVIIVTIGVMEQIPSVGGTETLNQPALGCLRPVHSAI